MGVKPSMPKMTVEFINRFTSSEQFERVFKEGMGLVEETANYLDGPGRLDSRSLDRMGAIAYATESMRLTTRLMQLASWLLLQRAIVSGELTMEEARKEKHRINLAEIGKGESIEGGEHIPDGLKSLMDRSLHLLERVRKFDVMVQRSANFDDVEQAVSPISAQLDQIQRAFATR
jgi:regulator of CtrA degradation